MLEIQTNKHNERERKSDHKLEKKTVTKWTTIVIAIANAVIVITLKWEREKKYILK